MMLAVGMVACGDESAPNAASGDDKSSEITAEVKQEKEEKKEEKKEKKEKEMDLPNWKGVSDYVGLNVPNLGHFGVKICYPSLKPASSGWAYQMDPALVFVTTPGINP